MSIRKKRKNIFFKTSIMIFLLLCIFVAVHPERVAAATNATTAASTSKEEVTEYMPMRPDGGTVTTGRYQFNYIGNWNYFSNINSVYGYEDEVRRNTYIAGFTNSSGATLTNSSNATGIVKAYLIWETRQPYVQSNESANHVIVGCSNDYRYVYPNYVYNDNRTYSGWGNIDLRTCYVMVADVTNIVKAYGYGDCLGNTEGVLYRYHSVHEELVDDDTKKARYQSYI